MVEHAARASVKGRVGVVGTRGTITSGAFEIELHKLNPKLTVLTQACPLLVPLIEEHWHTKPEAHMILKKYLRPLKTKNPDTLILGCTHYPLMMKDFKRLMGKRVNVLDSGKIVAESLVEYLQRHPEIETQLTKGGAQEFVTTENAEKFTAFVRDFAGLKIGRASQVTF